MARVFMVFLRHEKSNDVNVAGMTLGESFDASLSSLRGLTCSRVLSRQGFS